MTDANLPSSFLFFFFSSNYQSMVIAPQLDVQPLQTALADQARAFADQLIHKLADDYTQFNKRICASFELIARRALQEPEDSKEMIDQVQFYLPVTICLLDLCPRSIIAAWSVIKEDFEDKNPRVPPKT